MPPQEGATTSPRVGTSSRLTSLDAWRGLIIVVMALDHANGFIAHGKLEPEMWAGPFPDYQGDWLVFLTRWVTHLAAPGFFFLLGAGAVLFAGSRRQAGWSGRRIAAQLVVRGALLILLQFTLENAAWRHGEVIGRGSTYIGVLYALGGVLVVSAFLLRLPAALLAAGSIALLAVVEATMPDAYGPAPLWRLLFLQPSYTEGWFSLYPLVPWLGVAGLGMAFGKWAYRDSDRALIRALPLGLAALVAFVVLRLADGFGNMRPQQTDDAIGFLNLVKYPPAITFLLMTLGLGLLAAWLFSRPGVRRSPPIEVLSVYGSVPLFFYITHLWLYAQMGRWLDRTSIAAMYFWWFLGLAALYPACWAYGRFKRTRPAESLWRFL